MSPAVSVFTCSYDKPAYAPEAIASVLAQDMGDFEYFILENSDDGGETRAAIAPLLGDPRIIYEEIEISAEDRARCYPGAWLFNRYYGKASGEYVIYLADDDLFEPGCFSACLRGFADYGDWCHAVWFTMWRTAWDEGQGRFRPAGSIPAVQPVGTGHAQVQADCRIDGGQVMHRRVCLEEIPHPWFPEARSTAHHCDGLFLQKLADLHGIYPVTAKLLTHRATPISTWDKS